MVLATNIEKSHPHGPQHEYLCLASSPFSNQKIELPFLPSFLNHCPTAALTHYLLRRSWGPVGAILQAGLWEDQSGVSSKLQAPKKVETFLSSHPSSSTQEGEPGSGGGSLSLTQTSASPITLSSYVTWEKGHQCGTPHDRLLANAVGTWMGTVDHIYDSLLVEDKF